METPRMGMLGSDMLCLLCGMMFIWLLVPSSLGEGRTGARGTPVLMPLCRMHQPPPANMKRRRAGRAPVIPV